MNYPEESISYWKYDKNTKADFERVPSSFTESQKESKHKLSYLRSDLLTHTKGSTYMEYGNTKVIVAINPLLEKIQFTLRPKEVFPIFVTKYACFATAEDGEEKSRTLDIALRKAIQPSIFLEQYFNVKIQIVIYVLEDDGCALGTAINCCATTLADNGISILGIVTASTVLSFNNHIFYNPTAIQENFVKKFLSDDDNASDFGLTVVASIPSLDQISESYHVGFSSNETFDIMILAGMKLNQSVLDTIKNFLIKSIEKYEK